MHLMSTLHSALGELQGYHRKAKNVCVEKREGMRNSRNSELLCAIIHNRNAHSAVSLVDR